MTMLAIPALIIPALWRHPFLQGVGLSIFVLLVAAEIRTIYRTRERRSVKDRAMRLSATLVDWIYNHLENEPHFSSSVFSEIPSSEYQKITAESRKYEEDTVYLYVERFGQRVKSIRREFAEHGIVDTLLDSACDQKVVVAETIRVIGRRIQELAEEMPD